MKHISRDLPTLFHNSNNLHFYMSRKDVKQLIIRKVRRSITPITSSGAFGHVLLGYIVAVNLRIRCV